MVGLEDSPELVEQRLEACRNRDEYRILTDAMTLYCTPTELASLLAKTRSAKVGSAASEKLSPLAWFRLRALNRRWRRRVEREIARSNQAGLWERERLSGTVIHYHGPAPASQKTLIVGFTGNYFRLMMPIYRILLNIEVEACLVFEA